MPNIDLTALPGWASLSSGSHSITIVAKAENYRDSEPSAAVSVTKAAPTLISFTIAKKSYQAEEGMTWEQWCNSSYNADGYVIHGDIVLYRGNGSNIVHNGNIAVLKSDLIVSGISYTLGSGGTGN